MTSCVWLGAFERIPEYFCRATFICTWPSYQHLISVIIKPGEYTGLTALGIATFGLTSINLFAAGSGELLSVTCDTL